MSPEERQLLVDLFKRINAVSTNPRDADAEAFIAEAVRLQPYAPYLLSQTVIVQEQALRAANDRLQQLEAENRDLKSAGQPQQQSGGFLGGLGSLFGGGQQQPAQRPPQGGPWGGAPQGGAPMGGQQMGGPQGGPWGGAPQQGGGGGFLKGALGAAAGVAGGVLLANSISSLFHGSHGNPLGIASGSSSPTGAGGETLANNNYGGAQNASGEYGGGNDSYTSNADFQDDGYDSDDGYDV